GAVDHYTAEVMGCHVAKIGDRWAALEPIRQGMTRAFGSRGAPGVPDARPGTSRVAPGGRVRGYLDIVPVALRGSTGLYVRRDPGDPVGSLLNGARVQETGCGTGDASGNNRTLVSRSADASVQRQATRSNSSGTASPPLATTRKTLPASSL